MSADKRALRLAARATRAAIPATARRAAAERMVEPLVALLGAAAAVGVYAATGDEADPASLVARLLADGKRVAYPRLDPPGFAFVATPEALVAGPRGLPVPPPGAPDAPLAALDALIVPGLAFDAAGGRLGQGGGWYDRLLGGGGGAARPRLIGLAFAAQIVEALPREAHDVAMDVVVTEAGALLPGAPRRG